MIDTCLSLIFGICSNKMTEEQLLIIQTFPILELSTSFTADFEMFLNAGQRLNYRIS